MLKRILKRAFAALLILSMLLPLVSCTTVSNKWYVSKEKNVDIAGASQMISTAQSVTDAYTDIQYTYAFFVEVDLPEDVYRLGTENVISFTGRGTDNVTAHRKNTYTALQGDSTSLFETDEDFYLSGGNIYTKRFGKNYRSYMSESEFIPYTEYSDISVNTDYLSENNFTDVTVYKLFGSKTEIVFENANEYIKSGIIAFTGLDETDYTYTVNDVALSVLIDKNGALTEKHLTFTVDYYEETNPSAYLTYEGDFAYTLDKTEGVTVSERDRSIAYQEIQNIALLSSLTSKGYEVLLTQGSLDALYSKYVKVTDSTSKEYVFDASAHITTCFRDGATYYASIDTDYYSKDNKTHNTTGIFQDPSGFSQCYYDYTTDTRATDVQQTEAKYTDDELYTLITSTLTTEQLFEDEIASVSVKSETDSEITFSLRFNNLSAKLYAAYLVDTFSESNSSADLNSQAFALNKCDIEITVRKSDGCILKQLIDFNAEITGTGNLSGYITVEGLFLMQVNSTDNIALLTPEDFDNTVNGIKNS